MILLSLLNLTMTETETASETETETVTEMETEKLQNRCEYCFLSSVIDYFYRFEILITTKT